MKLVMHGEEITCKDCGAVLEVVPMEGAERARFAFDITHRRDGTAIKNLDTKGPALCVIELGWCSSCERHSAAIDSVDDPVEWAKLPKWHKKN